MEIIKENFAGLKRYDSDTVMSFHIRNRVEYLNIFIPVERVLYNNFCSFGHNFIIHRRCQ